MHNPVTWLAAGLPESFPEKAVGKLDGIIRGLQIYIGGQLFQEREEAPPFRLQGHFGPAQGGNVPDRPDDSQGPALGIGYERGVDQYRDLAPVFGQEVALQVPGVALFQAGGEAGKDLGGIPVYHQLRGQFSQSFPAPAEILRQGFVGVGDAPSEVGNDHPVQHAVNGLDRHGGGGRGFLGLQGFGGAPG